MSKPISRQLSAVVQVTDKCNLACSYCYVGEGKKEDMSEETFSVLLDKMDSFVGPLGHMTLIYHGGEPLVRGLDFYKFASKKIQQLGKHKVDACIQTNGTLIDDKVADFLIEQNLSCGISLDGPEELHDSNRYFHNRKGSFKKSMEGIKKLRERGRNPGALTVITKKSLPRVKEMYNFFNQNKLNFQLNPIDLTGRAKDENPNLVITPQEYGQVLVELFDCWYNDTNTNIKITNLFEAMQSITDGQHRGCLYSTSSCGRKYLGVNPLGDVYPCSRFTSNDKFLMGNVHKESIDTMFEASIFKEFNSRNQGLEECKPCEYESLCNGGCTSRAYSQSGEIGTKDYYCDATKMIFKHIENTLNQEVEWRKK